jgi:hypothetical protein
VFSRRVLSLTTCRTTPDAAEAPPAGSGAQADVRTSQSPKRGFFTSKLRCMRGIPICDLHTVSLCARPEGNGVAVVNQQAVMPQRAWRCSF